MGINRYTAEEILARLQASYLHEQQLDPEVEEYQQLTLETTVRKWRDICDLPEPYQLADHLNHLFELNIPAADWVLILQPEKINILKAVCEFIAKNAVKPVN
jgi:hypothetical protein